MTDRTDNFNRADSASSLGTPSDGGSAWVVYTGAWGINTNQGYLASTAGDNQNTAALESSVSDCDVQGTLTTVGSDGGICARLADTNNYLLWTYTANAPNHMIMYKRVAGAFTQIGIATYTAANGDVLKLSMSGSTLNGYVNGTLKVGPITDSAGSTNTKHGLRSFTDTTMRFDDFSITGTGGGGSFNPGWTYGATRTVGAVF